ncbi:hypothetical protein PC9H_009347 [Pleurotus ostreatus]|uniref:F-box domain-containing protein n=1 Tax=Pleurotus ostreatus TaxID=5322 RepID=A0A8H7DRZ8_PLEOS|nr:uncharacterized protein PC9H_009347 [Pleurotus ostreatus]KAF7424046.1 hypothetical protein PC9H_009347 [Pleurotus ostreatus]
MFPNQTADQRLAMVPEILSQIFEGSWRGEQVRSARVSRFWCNLVLNLIWKRLDDLGVLFRLLAPLTPSNGVIAFTRALTSKDWARFNYYANFYEGDDSHAITMLAEALPRLSSLESLTLPICWFTPAVVDAAASSEHHAITYRELSTITRLTALQSDGIRHTMPLQLVADDIIAIARALPNLSDLSLNPALDVAAASTLVVSVLSPPCDLCLISLGLYLNAANEHIPPPPSIDEELQQAVPEKVGFASLRKLTVWFSSLASPVPLAVYLSNILPPGCVLIFGSYGELRPEEPGPTAYSYVQASASPRDANWSIASRPRCSLSLTLTGLSMVTIDLASFLFFIYIGTAHINMMPAAASCAQAL